MKTKGSIIYMPSLRIPNPDEVISDSNLNIHENKNTVLKIII